MKKIDKTKFTVLAIESSCDETAAAVIHVTCNMKHIANLEIKSNIISSQVKLHAKYGGVYPELASREHIRNVIPVLQESLSVAEIPNSKSQILNKFQIKNPKNESLNENCKLKIENSVDAIAVTVGPGLIGSLLVGVNTAKTLAYVLNKPIYAINHLEGHIYSCFAGEIPNNKSQISNKFQIPNSKLIYNSSFTRLESAFEPRRIIHNSPKFPILALVVSGGHTSLVYMKNHFDYHVIGETLDDAAGEAFDKVAKMLGLGYPGGPAIAKMAMQAPNTKSSLDRLETPVGQIPNKLQFPNNQYQNKLTNQQINQLTFSFPRPMIDSNNFDFSFSGLKTSVLYTVDKIKNQKSKIKMTNQNLKLGSDVNLSDEIKALICYEFQEAVVDTLVTKTLRAAEKYQVKSVLLCGGVSANDELRRQFELGIRNYELGNKSSKKLQATSSQLQFFVPDKKLSTDNAAMIGIAAAYRVVLGKKPTPWYDVNADANAKLH